MTPHVPTPATTTRHSSRATVCSELEDDVMPRVSTGDPPTALLSVTPPT